MQTTRNDAPPREAAVERKTRETDIALRLNVDGAGKYDISTGVAFFDHMLCALARYGAFDLFVRCEGDLAVDAHHTVEDTGIALGTAIKRALGDCAGINRLGEAHVPMDEALAFAALDISGRGFLAYDAPPPGGLIGAYDAQLTVEFMRALACNAGITLHMRVTGLNAHHMAEAAYKALGRALRRAAERDGRMHDIPSTKGVI